MSGQNRKNDNQQGTASVVEHCVYTVLRTTAAVGHRLNPKISPRVIQEGSVEIGTHAIIFLVVIIKVSKTDSKSQIDAQLPVATLALPSMYFYAFDRIACNVFSGHADSSILMKEKLTSLGSL